mmetsp:Transcript_12722/g.19610  ORF Transcript_12722/g.19610 Transcript_12722/m.19610 type:complete len:148 (-) Transcript_12722:1898-2341(-)
MVASINGNAAVLSTACAYFLLVGGWVDAWTTINNNNHIMRIPRNSSDSISTTSTPAVATSSSSTSTYSATISATTNELNLRQRQKLLQSALTHARQTDQKFGLSAPESIHAWSIVDELYVAIPEYSSAVEESVRKVFGEKQKSVWDL